mgnify:CR=1 FL=1
MQSQAVISALQKSCDPKNLPDTLVALRHDRLAWQFLCECDFDKYSQWLLENGAAGAWSPANLALFVLDADLSAQQLSKEPMCILDGNLQRRALAFFEETLRTGKAPIDLKETGLLALALRERRRKMRSWSGLAQDLTIQSKLLADPLARIWDGALTCLAGMVPDRNELLRALWTEKTDQAANWCIQIVLGNPADETLQAKTLSGLILDEPLEVQAKWLKLVEGCGRKQLSEKIARILLSGNQPNFDRYIVQKIDPEMAAAERLTRGLEMQSAAEVYRAAGAVPQAASLLEKSRQAVGQCLAEVELAIANLDVDRQKMDLAATRVDRAVKTCAVPSTLERGAEILQRAGIYDVSLPAVGSEPGMAASIYLASQMAVGGNSELARQTASQAVNAWLAAAADGIRMDGSSSEPADLLAALLRMDLLEEADRCAAFFLQARPNDDRLLQLAAQIAEKRTDLERAATLVEILVSLDPQNLPARRGLARLEEEQGQWQKALDQWRMVLSISGKAIEEDLLSLSRCAIEAGAPDAAIDACNQVLAKVSDHGLAHTYAGQAFLQKGMPQEAISHLSRATLLCPDLSKPWIALAEAQQSLGEAQRAVDTLRAAILAAPESSEVHFKLARLLLDQGYLTDALPNLRQAARLSPENVSVTIELANTLRHLGHLEEAIRVIHEARQRWPKNPHLAYLEGTTFLDMGNPQRALESLELAIKGEQPQLEWLRAYAQLKLHDTAQLFAARADDYNPLDLQKANQALQKILAIAPTDFNARMWMADTLRMRGQERLAFETYRQLLDEYQEQDDIPLVRVQAGFGASALAANELDTALAVLQEAAQAAPENLGIVHLIAETYLKLSLENEAAHAANQALQMEPDQVNNLIWYSNLMEKMDRLEDAQRALATAAQFSPESSDLWLKQAQFALKAGQPETARKALAQLQQLATVGENGLWQAAALYLKLNDNLEALRCLKSIAENTETPDPALMTDLAFLSHQTGQFAEAQEYVERAVQMDDQNIRLHVLQADLLAPQGKIQAALACLEKATRLMESKPLGSSGAPTAGKSLFKADDLAFTPAAVYVRSAVLLVKMGDFPAALYYAEKALEVAPGDSSIRVFTANLAYSQLHFDQVSELASAATEASASLLHPDPDACRQVLRAMHCEIMLDAGAEDGMDAGFADERDGELAVPDRLLTVQARWMARNGEYEAAWKLFQEIENRRTSGGQPGEECIPAAALGRYYQIDLDVYASLWMGLAAQDLYLWDSADRFIDQGRKEYAAEAIGAFQFASALIRRQKAARLCEAALSTRHCPAAMKNVGQDFEHALAQVSQLSGAADIAQLRQKGKLVFQASVAQIKPILSDEKALTDPALLIIALSQIGNLDAAIQAAKEMKDCADVCAHLAVSLANVNSEKALACIERAVDLEPRQPIYHALRAVLAAGSGRPADVAEAWLAALQTWPDEPAWHASLAQLSQQMGDALSAIQHWEEALALQPSEAGYALHLGQVYLETRNIGKAINTLEQAARLEPKDARIWLALAEAQLQAGHLELALQCTQQVTMLEPDSLPGMLLQGEILIQMGNLNAAQEISDRAMTRGNSIPEVVVFNVHLLVKRGKLTDALEVLEQAAGVLSGEASIQVERVELIRQVYGSPAALPVAREVAQKFPGNQDVQFLLAFILFECGDMANADAVAQRALRPDFENPALSLLLGRIKANLGQLDQAVFHLTQAVEHNPANVEAYIELGKTYQQRREQDKAVLTFQQAIKVAPRDPRAFVLAAAALKEAKDYSGAEKMLRKASELAPNDLTIHRQLGAIIALNLVQHSQEAQAWR